MKEASSTRALRAVGVWGLVGLLLAVPFAVGGMRWDVQVASAGVALVLLMVSAYGWLSAGVRAPWPLWIPALLVGVGLLQLLPLPTGVLELLSPAAADLRSFSLGDLGLYQGTAHPLSLDPAATWVALFHQAAFVAVALVAANADRAQRRLILRAIAVSAALVSLVGLAHWATGAERIYGLYEPRHSTRLSGYFATFVNANTQASFLVLGALVAVGLVAGSTRSFHQRLALVAAALAGAGAILSGSRGGVFALVVGLFLFAGLAHAREPDLDATRRRARTVANVALLLGLLAILAALVASPDLRSLGGGDLATEAKFANWEGAAKLAGAFWATGTGRGTFAYVFPRYRETLGSTTVTHPENIFLQLTTEWGLLFGAAAILAGVLGWWRIFTGVGRASRPIHWGVVAGLAAVGVHQLVDFGLESVSLSLPVAAALGVGLGEVTRRVRGAERPHPVIAGAVLAIALVLAFMVARYGPAAVEDHPDRALASLRSAPDEQVRDLARALAGRHPADYMIPLTAAARLGSQRDRAIGDSMRWLNRALYLYPSGHRPHLLGARLLLLAGHAKQAAIEYRLAIEAAPWRALPLAKEVARRLGQPALVAHALPPGHAALEIAGNTLIADGRAADAKALMEVVLADHPNDADAHQVRGRACLELRDAECAEAESAWLVAHDRVAVGYVYRARLYRAAGDHEAARHAIEAGASAGADIPAYHRIAATVYADLGDLPAALRSLDRLWVLTGARPSSGAATLTLRGQIEGRLADQAAAARSFARAYDLEPTPQRALLAVQAAHQTGGDAAARRILADATERWPESALVSTLRAQEPAN